MHQGVATWNADITTNIVYKYGKLCYVYVGFRTTTYIPPYTSLFSIPRPVGLYEVLPPSIRMNDLDEVKNCLYDFTYSLIINKTELPSGHEYVFEWMYFAE